MPGDHAPAILFKGVQRLDAALPDPMHVVAEADGGGFGVAEIVVKLAGLLGHLRRVIMHAQFQPESVEALAQLLKRCGLGLEFFVGLLPSNGVGVATDHDEAGLPADLGAGQEFGHHLAGRAGLVEPRPRIEADGLEALGPELLGEPRVLFGVRAVHKSLKVIVAGVPESGEDLRHVQLFVVALGVLAPAKDIGADQRFPGPGRDRVPRRGPARSGACDRPQRRQGAQAAQKLTPGLDGV